MNHTTTRDEIIIKLLSKGFTQSEIARMLDMTRQRVNQIVERQEREPISDISDEELDRLAEI